MAEHWLSVMVTDDTGTHLTDREGPYFIQARAERVAIRKSRELTSPTVLVRLDTYDATGKVTRSKGYRMGRLYKP